MSWGFGFKASGLEWVLGILGFRARILGLGVVG